MGIVHVFYNGQSEDIPLEDLIPEGDRAGLGIAEDAEITTQNLTGDQIKRALANHYDQPLEEFNEMSVDYHKNGNATVRPQATFGNT